MDSGFDPASRTVTLARVGSRRDRPVVGLGLCVVDHAYRVADLAGGERTRYSERVVGPGGMVANALIQVAALGIRPQLISLVGDDREGRWLLGALRERGVGTRWVVRSPADPTTTAVVLVDTATGERRFVLPDRRSLERRAAHFDCRSIRPRSVLLIDGHFPREAKRALRLARERGATTIADFALARAALDSMLPFVDYPVVARSFIESAGLGSPREGLRWLRDRTGGTPVVTLGREGALVLVGGRFRRIRPHRVRVRDSTGAGDAFHGAFAAGVAQGMPLLTALDLASRAGAYACRALGATRSLLHRPAAETP